MVTPVLESNTPALHDTVLEAFVAAGLPAEPIRNAYGENLAVLAKNVMDPAEMLGSVHIHELPKQYESTPVVKYGSKELEIGDVLPLSGSNVYPKKFLDIMDMVVQAATGKKGLATNLRSSAIADDEYMDNRGSTIGLHPDFIGDSQNYSVGNRLQGLNMHYTRWGSSLVRLGLLRDIGDDKLLYTIMTDVNENRPGNKITDYYEMLGAPFTEPFELNAGDLLVFQAQHHHERGLTPVVHEFVTTSDTRRSDVFKPMYGKKSKVLAQRAFVAGAINLADMGYDYGRIAA